jgi:hypothetical protein
MATQPSLWWWSAKKYWATQIDGKRLCLVKGRKNKQLAQEKLDALLAERKLLASVDGPLTVAALCEEFLEDVQRNLAPKTYDSYRYGCQMFVDEYGALPAHTIKPLQIRHFTISLEKRLNSTTQGIVLRSVQRCFNWGVEEQIIPPHSLGRIRKPTSVRRDRYLMVCVSGSLLLVRKWPHVAARAQRGALKNQGSLACGLSGKEPVAMANKRPTAPGF